MKTHLFLALMMSVLTSAFVSAEVFHWPQVCEHGELVIRNNGTKEAAVWLQKFNRNLIRETELEIPAKTSVTVNLESLLKDERLSLLNIDNAAPIAVNYKCGGRDFSASKVEGGENTFSRTPQNENQFWLQNLYSDKNEFRLEYSDAEGKITSVQQLPLASLQALLYSVPDNVKQWKNLKITGSEKAVVFSLTETGNEPPIKVVPQKSETEPAAYFLIGPRTGNADSFIVKIPDEKTAERARELIKFPEKEKMVFAKIQKHHSGFNRNWSRPEKSFWSWSASEVTNFADLGSTACNGTPQEVEDRMEHWIIDPGQICFWNYRVKKELTPSEVALGL